MSATLQHDAFIYGSESEFLATIVPFLREGIAKREGTVVATNQHNRGVLERALGRDAAEVLFVPASDVYTSPHGAVSAYHNVLDMFRRQGRASVRAIGEVLYGDSESEHEKWLRYESIAEGVFADAALEVICPYDLHALPGRLIEHAQRTHRHVYHSGQREESSIFIDPEVMLHSLPPEFSADVQREPDIVLDATERRLAVARRRISEFTTRHLSRERAEEATLAIGEALANGVLHGKGRVIASLWAEPERVICRINNDGSHIVDAFAGYRPPTEPENGGMGFWIARQLSDQMHIGHDRLGPAVTLAFQR